MKKQQFPRPVSVTIISVLLLVMASFGIWLLIDALRGGEGSHSDPALIAYLAISPVIYAGCGIFMLRGANWARVLFFVLVIPALFVLVLASIAGGVAMVPRLLFAVIISLSLLSRHANRFFPG